VGTSSSGWGGHGSRGRRPPRAKGALGEAVLDAVLPDPEALLAAGGSLPTLELTVPAIVIRVRVKPNSRASLLTRLADGSWVAHVKSPAIEGKANQELVVLIAQQFHCVKAAVSIKSGASGRVKLVKIEAE
jgi:uncharacterized protein (TIGR00251 family)